MNMKMKKLGKISSIFEFSISKLGYMDIFMKIWEKMKWKSSLTISLFNFDYLSDEDRKKVNTKNEDEYEKICKNEFDFWILNIKIKLCDNFHENLRRKRFDPFFKTFLTNQDKNENGNKKLWEN